MSATHLFDAVRAGDVGTVRTLLDADPALIQSRNDAGLSPVLWACYLQQPQLARELADRADDLDMFEAAALDDAAGVRALLAADPSAVRARTADGHAPLGLAAFFGAGHALEQLLAAGADPNAQSDNEMRVAPLHSAAAAHRADLIRMLLDAGAEPNARQHGGWTPLHQAAHSGDTEIVELLLAAGADPAPAADDGSTPADQAAAAGHDHLANRLRAR